MAVTEVDVLLVGAGLAGIGVAHYLHERHPNKRYLILESREVLGGTWDLFRYPGIRSDSRIPLYAYSFKPWVRDRTFASGEDILQYLRDAASEDGIDRNIRYGTKVTKASWSSEETVWTVETEQAGETKTYRCRWLQLCSGYYRYDEGYTPEFPGRDAFQGPIVHPQHWPEDFDASGKRVVVIGSGATAITLIPSLSKQAKHIVMLQRSPTYIHMDPAVDRVAKLIRRVLPERLAYRAIRRKNLYLERIGYRTARSRPDKAKAFLKNRITKALPRGYDVRRHFVPKYQPWDQRICLDPDGDFFSAIRDGHASVVTGHIDTFVENGIRMKSGELVEADVIITATGLNMQIGGDIAFDVDGAPVQSKDAWIYKGVMLSGIPNMMLTAGTLIASYTLRVELIGQYLCDVLEHMDRTSARVATPKLPMAESVMPKEPFVTGFSSGYLLRAIDTFPSQGPSQPWRNVQSYDDNKAVLRAPVNDGVLAFR